MFLLITHIVVIMAEVQAFERRLQQSVKLMQEGNSLQALQYLKQLNKEVRDYLHLLQVGDNDQLAQMQIAIYNNLAWLYQKRGKYKSSLYHLEIAQKLENRYFTHKYKDSPIPPAALEKLATTYSNLSAIQSRLDEPKEAQRNVQFAIELLKKHPGQPHPHLLFLYYNMAVLLQTGTNYNEASAFGLQGLQLSKKCNNHTMIEKYQLLLQALKDKLVRVERRKEQQIRKYLRGETGVVCKMEVEPIEPINNEALLNITKISFGQNKITNRLSTIQPSRARLNSTAIQTANSLKRQFNRSSSYHTAQTGIGKLSTKGLSTANLEANRTLEEKGTTIAEDSILEIYGGTKRTKFTRPIRQNRLQTRIRERRHKLEHQIGDLTRKNEVLERIIEKMYMSEKG